MTSVPPAVPPISWAVVIRADTWWDDRTGARCPRIFIRLPQRLQVLHLVDARDYGATGQERKFTTAAPFRRKLTLATVPQQTGCTTGCCAWLPEVRQRNPLRLFKIIESTSCSHVRHQHRQSLELCLPTRPDPPSVLWFAVLRERSFSWVAASAVGARQGARCESSRC